MRIHRVRREMERERKRLGLSIPEYMEYIRRENDRVLAQTKKGETTLR